MTDYLVKAGLPANRFTPIGYGSTQPLGSNDTDEGKAQNRRIDFVVRIGEWRIWRHSIGAGCWRRCCSALPWAGSRWSIAARAYRRRLARWLAGLAAALVAAALARVVPGRSGYWLDLGLIMFALYLAGCAVGSWLRDWAVSRHRA